MDVVEHGAGRPIVFVHGWRLSGDVEALDMEPAFATRSGWRRIYPSLPGMGKSKPDPRVGDLDDYLDLLIRFVQDEVGPARGFAIAGTSAGASLARAVAHSFPTEIRGLMLRVPMLEADRRPQFASDADRDQVFDAMPSDPWIPPAFKAEAREKLSRVWQPARAIADTVGFASEIRNDPSRYVLHHSFDAILSVPALLIGGRQDTRVGYEDAISVLPQYPRATLLLADRAGHVMPTGKRGLFDAAINDWLDRMEEVW